MCKLGLADDSTLALTIHARSVVCMVGGCAVAFDGKALIVYSSDYFLWHKLESN